MKKQNPSLQQPSNTEPAPDAVIEINGTESVAREAATEDVAHKVESVAPASSIHILGRRVVIAGLGAVLFGVEQVQNLLERATERGQMIEEDAQHKLADASKRSTEAVSSTLASLLNHLPGVRVAYQPLPEQPAQQVETAATPSDIPQE